jgi:hypothetical protein
MEFDAMAELGRLLYMVPSISVSLELWIGTISDQIFKLRFRKTSSFTFLSVIRISYREIIFTYHNDLAINGYFA